MPPANRELRFLIRRRRSDLSHDLLLEIGPFWHRWRIDLGPSPSPDEPRPAKQHEPAQSIDDDLFTETETHLLWDAGTLLPRGDPIEGLARGKLLFELRGFKLRGTWTLARGRGTPRGRGKPFLPSNEWVLLKKPDAWADPKGHYATHSILSGLAPEQDPSAARAAFLASLPPLAAAPPIAELERMDSGPARPAFVSNEWIFELDPAGLPVIASCEGLRSSVELTGRFPEIEAALRALPVEAVLDGALVFLDGDGRPDPDALAKRLTGASDPLIAVLFTFDLLAAGGLDLRPLPLLERKQHLRRLLPKLGPLMFADHLSERGDALADEVTKRGGFGMVARRAAAPYRAGPGEDRTPIALVRTQAAASAPPNLREGLDGVKVRLSNLDKIFWPEERYTKGDLLRYYRAVAEWMLPHLSDRPLVLTRFPDGIHGKSFFQHNAPGSKSAWLRTVRIEMSKRPRDYFLADDLESLLYLINLGTIPIHAWPSRATTLERPDWCVIDIDAGARGFGAVVAIALGVRALCDAVGLPTFPKTSGGSGMHVLIPLAGRLTFEQSRAVGELIARTIAQEQPEHASIELAIADRGGRVYLDHLVNARGRMLVAPYAVRPLAGAPVSTPLRWSEVVPSLDPRAFTIETVPTRLNRDDDPWRGMLGVDIDLATALERMTKRMKPDFAP